MNIKKIKAVGFGYCKSTDRFQQLEFERCGPDAHDIVLKIKYAGICGSDLHTVMNEWGNQNDNWLIPGHEILGEVVDTGESVSKFRKGDHALVGCMIDGDEKSEFYKHDRQQEDPKAIMTYSSVNWKKDNSITQGGYSNYIVVNEHYAFTVPQNTKLEKAAPLACASVTVYSPLRQLNIDSDMLVGIIGLGGLGGQCAQFMKALGCTVIAFDQVDKEEFADKLGIKFLQVENDYIDPSFDNKFDFILSTASTGFNIEAYLKLLKFNGSLVFAGLPKHSEAEGMFVSVKDMILKYPSRKIMGTCIAGIDMSQECIDFCVKHDIYPPSTLIDPNEESLDNAYKSLLNNDVNGRFVINMTKLKTEKKKDYDDFIEADSGFSNTKSDSNSDTHKSDDFDDRYVVNFSDKNPNVKEKPTEVLYKAEGGIMESLDDGYTVKPGDTLSQIAKRLNVPLQNLMQQNGLNEQSIIRPNQVLKYTPQNNSNVQQQKNIFSQYTSQPITSSQNAFDMDLIINNLWQFENEIKQGLQPDGRYKLVNEKSFGPGLDITKNPQWKEWASTPRTVQEINSFLKKNVLPQHIAKVKEYLQMYGVDYNKVPGQILNGLVDMRYQLGNLGKYKLLAEAIKNNDINGIYNESKVYIPDKINGVETKRNENGEIMYLDKRRHDLRNKHYFFLNK